MEEIILARIQELSETIEDCLLRRDRILEELRRVNNDVDKYTAVIFELKNIIESNQQEQPAEEI